ncbi:hypothetical protein PUN28_006470 [Cardiocondyla obscurior]|uniref:Uncharacterized protein n=1 Tax=Cardiocondyla obscurior TaxID=286306 RepID=A0AAW2GBP0_9HYME
MHIEINQVKCFRDIEIERRTGKFGNPCSGMLPNATHQSTSCQIIRMRNDSGARRGEKNWL